MALIDQNCSKHGNSHVPSFCLEHGLLVFCCPICLIDNKRRASRGKQRDGYMCNIITAATASQRLNLQKSTTTALLESKALSKMERELTNQKEYATKDSTACQDILEYFKGLEKSGVKRLGKFIKYFTKISELVADHHEQLHMFDEFLRYVKSSTHSTQASENSESVKCGKGRCATCPWIEGSRMLTNGMGKSFLIQNWRGGKFACDSKNVIYAITCTCKECPGKIYIGETQQTLRSRMNGHRAGTTKSVDDHFRLMTKPFDSIRLRVMYSGITSKIIRRDIERRLILEMKTHNSDGSGWNVKLGQKCKIVNLRERLSEQWDDMVEVYKNMQLDETLLQKVHQVQDNGTTEDPIRLLLLFSRFKGDNIDDITPKGIDKQIVPKTEAKENALVEQNNAGSTDNKLRGHVEMLQKQVTRLEAVITEMKEHEHELRNIADKQSKILKMMDTCK